MSIASTSTGDVRLSYVITAGHSGLMAQFDETGRLAAWTPWIKQASIFATAEAGMAAIRAICRREIQAAVRAGRAVLERDEATGEDVLMDYSGGHARPLPVPAINLDVGSRSLAGQIAEIDYEARDRRVVRRFAREAFAEARRNPRRQTEALITSRSSEDDYTMPASRRAKLAAAGRAYAGAT